MDRIRTALFLDFDNIFSGLLEVERRAAMVLAQDPGLWVERLRARLGIDGSQRDVLVQRAYLNPAGRIRDDVVGNDSGWVYLQKFRPNLTRAGFEVVDCPTLTTGQKNAADIRIVIDCLSILDAETVYDEFVVASSDADFTPLLQRIRSRDRRRIIIASGPSAPAYSSVANLVINETELVDLLLEPTIEAAYSAPEAAAPQAVTDATDDTELEALRSAVEAAVVADVQAAASPVLLSDLGLRVRAEFKEVIDRSNWFGYAKLGDFIRALPRDSGLAVSGYHVWCEGEHRPPTAGDQGATVGLPTVVLQVCRITNLPRLASTAWEALFETIAEYARGHEFHLTECTAWTRDRLTAAGHRVGRVAVGFVVRGARMAGIRLDSAPYPTAAQLIEAIADSTIDRALAQGLVLSTSEQQELRGWLMGHGADTGEAAAEA